jgi:hypothetical protein
LQIWKHKLIAGAWVSRWIRGNMAEKEKSKGHLRNNFIILWLAIVLLLAIGGGCLKDNPLQIIQIQQSSEIVYWHSEDDFSYDWTITITVHNSDDDIAAGRTQLVVSLYAASDKYDTKQVDDLAPLTSGRDANYVLHFMIGQKYGWHRAIEATLYLDGKQVDRVVQGIPQEAGPHLSNEAQRAESQNRWQACRGEGERHL